MPLSPIETEVIKDILAATIKPLMEWAAGYLRRPSKKAIAKKAEELVSNSSAIENAPEADRSKLQASAVDLVLPTFEQIVMFSPTTGRVVEAAGRVNPTARKFSSSRSADEFRSTASKKVAAKKSGQSKTMAKRALVKKTPAKKTAAKRIPAKATTVKGAVKNAIKKTAAKKIAARKGVR